jgi:hypothetical protein
MSSHDVGLVSMRKDNGFEEPFAPFGTSPGQDVVSADLRSRMQGVEEALKSLPQVA